jgi:STE24 endopeptidase
MPQTLFYIIIAIILADYLLELFLDYLNSTNWSDELPAELEGIYDAEKYRKSQAYLKVNQRFSLITDTFSLILILAVLFLGGFAFLDNLVRQYTVNPILMAMMFFGIIGLAADLLSTPFTLYDTFVIEERFGFNKMTVKTFILDKLKGWGMGLLLGGAVLAFVVWTYGETGEWFWLITWVVLSLFMIFMSMFYSNLIVPLFNKQTPLEDGPLREAIQEFAGKVKFRLKNIYVIDGSKRTTKANAYFTGLGPKKRIVLYDTLITEHSKEELVAVLAHEIGHYKKKHTLAMMVISILNSGVLLYVLSLFLGNPVLSRALGVEEPSFHIGILAFGLLYAPISLVTGLVMNMISRKNEYAADAYAGKHYDPGSLILALKILSVNNLSNLRPHQVYVFFNYSHPPLLSRLAALHGQSFSKKRSR